MKRYLGAAAALLALLAFAGSATAHDFDHPAPNFTPVAPPSPAFLSSPAGAWELVATIATGNPMTDLDFFTRHGSIFASVGTLAIGPNAGGQTIIRLTQGGAVTPQFVSAHPSASCVSDPAAALGLQHDAEAAPKGKVLFNTKFPVGVKPVTTDAQVILDATDNEGRCHDQNAFGLGQTEPQGGLEIVDVTNVHDPVEIGLTSHIGESHTVNVDPKRPHIAFAVTSDFVPVTCNADDTSCLRSDEDASPATTQTLSLDGFELVNIRSCLNFPTLTSVAVKRMVCRPVVYRYRWPSALIATGHTVDSLAGCHELEIYPNDRLTCAGVNATLLFDLSGAFDRKGTPDDYTDDEPIGTPLPCRVRPNMTDPSGQFDTGAMVTDCVDGGTDQNPIDLRICSQENASGACVKGWKAIGSPSLQGVVHVGTAFHQGRVGNTPPPIDARDDVEISHEAELTRSGKFILVTDERGGGVLPPGATCVMSPGDNTAGNGGLHAYRVHKLLQTTPSGPDAQADDIAWQSYARTPGGAKAIYRAPVVTAADGTVCDSHVFHQIPGQNRIFMAWYSQGTQVVDFVERRNGTFEFQKVGHFVPANANSWVSAVFKMQKNADGTFTYWGATGDFNLGQAGRNAIDIYKVTLPAPAQ